MKVSKIQRKNWKSKYPKDWNATYRQDVKELGGVCDKCGLPAYKGNPLERDHIIPITRGGKHSQMNKRLLHKHGCHTRRHRKKL